jgi:DNA-binding NarL/FixJ family response regulator
MQSYRLILADDHTLVRQGIRKLIEEESSLAVVGEVGDGLDLLDLLRETEADLILLDISMPNLQGIEAIPEILKIRPAVKILILSMHKNEHYLCSAVAAGANGYILKEDSDVELLPAIEAVMQGRFAISPQFAEKYWEDPRAACREKQGAAGYSLSPRERQILKMAAEGITSKDIAEKFNISKRTVDHHRASLMKKLRINKSADLIKYAIQQGYVTQPVE